MGFLAKNQGSAVVNFTSRCSATFLAYLANCFVQMSFVFILFQGSKPLLLHSLFSQEKETNSEINTETGDSGLPRTKKRKHMTAAEREKADKERERAIMAYRLMRKQRLQEKKEAM